MKKDFYQNKRDVSLALTRDWQPWESLRESKPVDVISQPTNHPGSGNRTAVVSVVSQKLKLSLHLCYKENGSKHEYKAAENPQARQCTTDS